VATATVIAAAPQAVHDVIVEPYTTPSHRQQYLVVREKGKWPRVLAVVELLSPANKSGSYVPKYHEKRINLIASPAHFLEIDLLRAGHNPLRDRFPELPRTPFFIFLARKLHPDRKEEAYPLGLREPLPVINLPLSEGRSDLPLDLGAAFRSAYDLSVGEAIQYRTEQVPEPPLSAEDAQWVAALLAQQQVAAAK
jgi:uncharacterized protein DUF4058